MIYAGIGARKTPDNILTIMRGLGFYLAQHGLMLRSGRQPVGADAAFEFGCKIANGQSELFAPQPNYAWMAHAEKHHPAWNKCDQYARERHARNSAVMLGFHLDTPVKFVACWTANGAAVGGTGQALRIAKAYDIPVFNLFNCHSDAVWHFIRSGAWK